MTNTLKEKLQWLIDGNQLIDDDENILSLMSLNLAEKTTEEPVTYEAEELEDLNIFIHPLQIEVDRLKAIIAMQNEEIQKEAKLQKEKPGRKLYVRLTKTEIAEACQKVVDDSSISTSELARQYKCSDTTMARHLESNKIRITHKRGPNVQKSN